MRKYKNDPFSDFNLKTIKYAHSFSEINNVVITGGTGRIGSVFVRVLLSNNIKVLSLSRNKKKFDSFRKTLDINQKKNLFWEKIDLENFETINKLIKKKKNFLNKTNILINNASTTGRGFNYKLNEKNLVKEFKTSLVGSIYFTEKMLPFLRKNKNSRIINLSSLWAFASPKKTIYPNTEMGPSLVYSISKSGLTNYTKYLCERESKYSIIVNSLVPGWFPRKGKKENKKYMNSIISNIPSKRIGKLEDIITSASFLLMNGSKYFNGQILVLDGGYSIY